MRQTIVALGSVCLLFGCGKAGKEVSEQNVAPATNVTATTNVSSESSTQNVGEPTPAPSSQTAALSVPVTPDAELAHPGDCLFILDGKKLIDGKCTNLRSSATDAVLYGEPNFVQITQDHDNWYSGSWGESHVDEDVDELLQQRGDCYVGKHTLVCLWKRGDRPPTLPKML